ncbi:hypothetical protein [Roseisolibacter sp. H3M3-2]|uniref:hypothetical protein n=1 Tax=Roseisolibacter sp. H3M3-2 TaxID=3031323 RepID=UPI0023D9E2FE|nr:hypothetical protein [Roseisolibacter sp. H3M3-2]MDF1505421.1 hypothetical protein [Roseisolibacter sp. H3M3-2]
MSSFRTLVRSTLAAALVAACADGTPTDPAMRAGAPSASKAEENQATAAARAASARFRNVDAAIAAGYAPQGGCVEVPGLGGMGIHYVNVAGVMNPALDPAEPEILVYEPQQNGRLRLVAVEYMQVNAPGSSRPSLFGHAFEDGPPVGPMQTYALHAWVGQHNPSGTFAAFNPTVSCQYAEQLEANVSAHAHH